MKPGLPPGVINFVTGLGEVVGTELTKSPYIQKIAFTGSTQIGKLVAKKLLDTMKRLTLELGGKSPGIILDDADFSTAIPMAVAACYLNNGQACIAASRTDRAGRPAGRSEAIGESGRRTNQDGRSAKQGCDSRPIGQHKAVYKRGVQEYIKSGIEEGAELVIGGEGLLPDLRTGVS